MFNSFLKNFRTANWPNDFVANRINDIQKWADEKASSEPYTSTVTSIEFPSTGAEGDTTKSNSLVFREPRKEEKTGLQKITLLNEDGKEKSVFLVVPERESVGYGNIRGWGSRGSQNMPLTNILWNGPGGINDLYKEGRSNTANMSSYGTLLTVPIDLIGGNAAMNNITKNERSEYTGEDKAVGLGKEGQSQGQILGIISDYDEYLGPQEAEYFLKNLRKNGYVALKNFEKPTRVQEHTGPAYVPGDILLGLLGLQPNRGAVGYTFKDSESNEDYKNFVKNLREAQKGNK